MAQSGSELLTIQGPRGYRGVQGVQGPQGIQGIPGVSTAPAALPSGYVEMMVPVGTTSAVLEDVGVAPNEAATTVTLTSTGQIAATVVANIKTQIGPDPSILGLALNINGVDYAVSQVNLSGVDDLTIATLTERSGNLAPGTYTVKLRFYRASVAGNPGVEKATIAAWGIQGSLALHPSWWGNVYGVTEYCCPCSQMETAVRGGSAAATPSNIGTVLARVCYFRPPADITVNKIRFVGVGDVADGVYRTAIYNGDTLARLTQSLPIVTSLNPGPPVTQTWGFADSVANPGGNLGLALTAGQLYFIAVSATAAGATAGLLCAGPTGSGTTGQVPVLPKSWPGSLDIDSGYMTTAYAQFTVVGGALPDPAAAIAFQSTWTGGFPAFFLDSNNA